MDSATNYSYLEIYICSGSLFSNLEVGVEGIGIFKLTSGHCQ